MRYRPARIHVNAGRTFFCRWLKRPQSDVQGRYFSFVHILFINWGPPVGPKPKIVSTFVSHEVPTSAAAGTGLKGNAVQNRDYARSCESPFSRPHILRHCPAGREGVRQGRVRRPASAVTPSALRDVRVRRQHFFRNLFVTMTAFGLCAAQAGPFRPMPHRATEKLYGLIHKYGLIHRHYGYIGTLHRQARR